ncbi:MAG: gliding motility lipoprotein GldH [Paludibacteraceae bacterium]|nr:gliding motility lipoprotein GldH [Paludibacteraceae bacterium]
MKHLVLFLILISILASCGRGVIYEESQSVDRNGWRIDSVKRFEFEVQDTTQFYNISILVRNTGDYEYQNLWFFIESVRPDMVYSSDTAQLFLADDFGRWIGSGIGSIYSALYEYKDSVKFGQKGKYLLNIRHGMRTDSLTGITDIGVKIKICDGEE